MNFVCRIGFVVAMVVFTGCHLIGIVSTLPENVGPVSVFVFEGQQLKAAVIKAAVHRGWTPEMTGDSTIRCTIVRRKNRVVIDVRLIDEKHYAIDMIESNTSARKVMQWVGNLQREIAKCACG